MGKKPRKSKALHDFTTLFSLLLHEKKRKKESETNRKICVFNRILT